MMTRESRTGPDVTTLLRGLRSELEQGQSQMLELDRHRQELRDGLLRIAGAIQVLEEFVTGPPASEGEIDKGREEE